MLKYDRKLKQNARHLRSNMTDSEQRLWSRLRWKQILGVHFYRQKPIGKYVVDFYAAKAKVGVEVDGSQHLGGSQQDYDLGRDAYLRDQGLCVLRFTNLEVLQLQIPLYPPFSKGDKRMHVRVVTTDE